VRFRKRLRGRHGLGRLLALVAFRDEMRFLPGLFQNLEGQVDGVVGLDDQSRDGSAGFVASQPLTLDVLTVPHGAQAELEDGRNHRALTEAAWAHHPDWLIGVDADERVERDFRDRAEREIRRHGADVDALWVAFRELWDAPNLMRVDGIWGQKRKACLFRASADHRFDDRRVHAIWASWPPRGEDYPQADLRLYHLRMIDPADRARRLERYRRIDPENEWQPIGYDYLLDEEGIQLDPIEPGREYVPLAGAGLQRARL
jgi:hypothetical protein